jgi:hypothetical protein
VRGDILGMTSEYPGFLDNPTVAADAQDPILNQQRDTRETQALGISTR